MGGGGGPSAAEDTLPESYCISVCILGLRCSCKSSLLAWEIQTTKRFERNSSVFFFFFLL